MRAQVSSCEICGKPIPPGGNVCSECYEEARNPPGAIPCPVLDSPTNAYTDSPDAPERPRAGHQYRDPAADLRGIR